MAEWKLNGNAGTNPEQDFLGTTDNHPLVIKTSGLERMRVSTNGNVGIGTAEQSRLSVYSSKPDQSESMVHLEVTENFAGGHRLLTGRKPSSTGTALLDWTMEVDEGDTPGLTIFRATRPTGGDPEFAIPLRIGWNGNVTVENDLNVGNNISVNGDITLQNADVAEQFEVIDPMAAEPGVVMVLDDEGSLAVSERAYDRRVAGVVSGAGSYRPGIVLDSHDRPGQIAIALVGKVFCRVDAETAAIAVGDLLTTSNTPGHAMKALDKDLAFGATLGKALKPLSTGKGMIPILVALQ